MTQPWSNQATALIVIQAGTGFTGLFIYNGAPTLGNLIGSFTTQTGTDPFGNPYQGAGPFTYRYHTPGGQQGYVGFTGTLFTMVDWTGKQQIKLQFTGGDAVGDGAVIANLAANAGLVGGTYGQAETWHNITVIAGGFSINPGGHVSYILRADNQVEMEVQNCVTVSTADGSTIVTAANGLPAAYRPLAEKIRPLAYSVTKSTVGAYPGACFAIETDGSIQCRGFAAADQIDGQFRYPLDN